MTKKKSKRFINGEWLKYVIDRRGFSVRRLTNPDREGSIDYDIRTVQRAIADNEITDQLLDEIARAIDVYPNFLRGKYLWTLEIDIMDRPEVRNHWLENYLNPDLFPYRMHEQEKLGSRRHLMNTLLMHGVSNEEFRNLSREDRESLERWLNVRVTETLKHWFPETARLDQADYYYVNEWQSDADVYDVMLDWLIEKGYAKAPYPDECCKDDCDPRAV